MHLRCEDCGGPEQWCLDRDGEVWVRCVDDSCIAHQQCTFWPEEPVWPEGVASASEGDDQYCPGESDPSETLTLVRRVDPSF